MIIKNFLRFLSCVVVLMTMEACSDDDDAGCGSVMIDFDGSSISYCDNEGTSISLNREQDEFIWQAMNLYYYWQDEVGDLSDDRFSSYEDFYHFLNGASSSEDLFYEDLLSPNDRFSWIVNDYVALENSFQGISTSFGYEFGLLRESAGSPSIFGYVMYVVPGGPADLEGLRRGDLFNKVNGTQMTEDNFESLLFDNSTYTLTLAEISDTAINSLDEEISITAIELIENPILLDSVYDLSGIRAGYLVYNQFVNNNETHRELNEVFGKFQSAGISELILDLRYNPGGSVTTTRILSSMIYGAGTDSQDLGTIVYNEKLSPYFNSPLRFLESLPILNEQNDVIGEEPLNRLNGISRIFILTSGSTASASELLIVGMDPYLDVTTIGTTTVGKNEGSLTLYDTKESLFLRSESSTINTDHTYAIQPIVSKLANSEGFTDYEEGLVPNITLDERNFLEDLRALGEIEEPLLAEALAIIEGTARTASPDMVGEVFYYKDDRRTQLEKTLIEPQYVPRIKE